jgi:hypothetical protein
VRHSRSHFNFDASSGTGGRAARSGRPSCRHRPRSGTDVPLDKLWASTPSGNPHEQPGELLILERLPPCPGPRVATTAPPRARPIRPRNTMAESRCPLAFRRACRSVSTERGYKPDVTSRLTICIWPAW